MGNVSDDLDRFLRTDGLRIYNESIKKEPKQKGAHTMMKTEQKIEKLIRKKGRKPAKKAEEERR